MNFHQGLVLVTGSAGCGKSSTLAALLDILNEERSDHILSIEDPIEIVHASKRSLVNQRQVERHTESFGRALRAALREDPDVISIGALRDLETISLALTAAETGHLVLAKLHTNNSIRTLAAGLPPRMRRKGSLEAVEGWKAVDDDSLRTLLREIASEDQWDEFEEEKDLDFAYGIPGVARFCANYFVQERGVGAPPPRRSTGW